MGDWNEPPPSKSDDFLLWYVQEESQPVASRWDGDRCVDYLQTTWSVECLNLTYRDESFSDHKILQGTFTAACNVDPAMRMIGTRSFLPGNVSLNDWTTTLEKAWEHVRVPHESNTEQEWLELNQMAEAAAMRALESLNVQKGRPPCIRPKGSLPVFAVPPTDVDFKSNCKTFRWRKLAKLLGRTRDYQRQLSAGRSPQHLLQNIKRTWPNSLAF